ncbi:MAG: lysylphosphatidylglycerol synthase transmembrane domain-containing protein [Candidatus Binatia bacterium]
MSTVRILIGIAISLICGYFAVHGVEWGAVWAAFARMNMWSLIPALGFLTAMLALRAYRWQRFVAPVQQVPVRPFWSATLIGFMANDILPLRAGEVVRAYALAHLAPMRMSTALGTMVLERVWDAVAVAILLAVTLAGFPLPQWLKRANVVLLGLCAVVLIGGWVITRRDDAWLSWLPPRLATLVKHFVSGFAALRSVSLVFGAIFLSLLIWLMLVGYYWVLLHGCGFTLPLQAAFVVTILTVFASAIPAAPGYLGTFQVAMVLALQFFAIPKEEALSFSLIAHLAQLLPIVSAGLIALTRARLPLWPSQLGKAEPYSPSLSG